ncbi:MAG: hypothetical protein GY830_10950 [Bacteroidetes bacterium]|nr:hypothetical protein [Bacteroidota bacterium]
MNIIYEIPNIEEGEEENLSCLCLDCTNHDTFNKIFEIIDSDMSYTKNILNKKNLLGFNALSLGLFLKEDKEFEWILDKYNSNKKIFNLIYEKDNFDNNALMIAVEFDKFKKFDKLIKIISKDKKVLSYLLTYKNKDKENILNIVLNKHLQGDKRKIKKFDTVIYKLYYDRIKIPYFSNGNEVYNLNKELQNYQLTEELIPINIYKEKYESKFFNKIFSYLKEDPKLLSRVLLSQDRYLNNALMQCVIIGNINYITKILNAIKDDHKTIKKLFKATNLKKQTIFDLAQNLNDDNKKQKILNLLNKYKK